MKIKAPGDTPLERLTALVRRVVTVDKADIDAAAKRYEQSKRRRRAARTTRRTK